jgi:hypothetical protein
MPNVNGLNIVLVHGGFVDGSGWEGVYGILKGQGYRVSVVQNPTLSLADDVAVTRRFLDKTKFAASFAADLDPEKAAFMADSQVPWGVEALSGTISEPAWRTKPSWYMVATEDRMIPPAAQRSCPSASARRSSSTAVVMRSTCRSPRR